MTIAKERRKGIKPCSSGMMTIVKKKTDESEKKESKFDKVARFIDFLKSAKQSKFTGYIKINFSQGQIGRIEKFEEILKG